MPSCSGERAPSFGGMKQLHQNLLLGKYVACVCDSVWYIGVIIEQSDQNMDVYIKFMKQKAFGFDMATRSAK